MELEEYDQDEFYNKYTLDSSIESKYMSEEGKLETFDEDWETLKKLNVKNIWTVIDGDDGNLWITPGVHFVNRVLYLVTKEQWKDDEKDYVY